MDSIILKISDKDDNVAYAYTKKICEESKKSDKYYKYLDDFLSLLDHPKSYVRTRAFILICSQARWDDKGKIKTLLPLMFKLFFDEKPSVVRQSLNAIKDVIVYRPELKAVIKKEIKKIDSSIYKESIGHLIDADIKDVMETIDK